MQVVLKVKTIYTFDTEHTTVKLYKNKVHIVEKISKKFLATVVENYILGVKNYVLLVCPKKSRRIRSKKTFRKQPFLHSTKSKN